MRRMIGDFWLLLRVLAPTVGLPLQGVVIELLDLFEAFHELGKLLELLPLIIGGLHRHAHINGCFNGRHAVFLILKVSACMDHMLWVRAHFKGPGEATAQNCFRLFSPQSDLQP
jgi:hypothetical protein